MYNLYQPQTIQQNCHLLSTEIFSYHTPLHLTSFRSIYSTRNLEKNFFLGIDLFRYLQKILCAFENKVITQSLEQETAIGNYYTDIQTIAKTLDRQESLANTCVYHIVYHFHHLLAIYSIKIVIYFLLQPLLIFRLLPKL